MKSEWKKVKLGDLCEYVVSGGTPKSTVSSYYNGGIPWLNTKEIHFNRIYKTEKSISQAGLENSSAKWVEANCVIVAMYGATAGNVAVNLIPVTTNQACCNLKLDEKKANFKYIYYYLKLNYTKLATLANGGAQQNLNAKIIKEFPVTLPSLSVQNEIAEMLWSIDDKIALNNKINDNLEQQTDLIYTNIFCNELVFCELGNVVETTSGGTPSRKHPELYENPSIYWVKSKELNGGFIYYTEEMINETALSKSSAKMLPSHSVLVAMYGATVGEYGIISSSMTCNQAVCALIPNDKYSYPYLYELIRHSQEQLRNLAVGSAQQNISQVLIKKLPIHSNVKKIQQFTKATMASFQMREVLAHENFRLEKMRDTLLPKLMSGEIDVTDTGVL